MQVKLLRAHNARMQMHTKFLRKLSRDERGFPRGRKLHRFRELQYETVCDVSSEIARGEDSSHDRLHRLFSRKENDVHWIFDGPFRDVQIKNFWCQIVSSSIFFFKSESNLQNFIQIEAIEIESLKYNF